MQWITKGLQLKDHIFLVDYQKVFELGLLAQKCQDKLANAKKRREKKAVKQELIAYLYDILGTISKGNIKVKHIRHLNKALKMAGMMGDKIDEGADPKKQLMDVAVWIGARINKTPHEVLRALKPEEVEPFRKEILVHLYQQVEKAILVAHSKPDRFLKTIQRTIREIKGASSAPKEKAPPNFMVGMMRRAVL